ncbi:MAG: S1C family serine protease [Acholeplasmataceae bacterium]
MRKKLLLIVIVLFTTLTLAGCMELKAQLPYESPSDYEQMRIDMINEVEPSVIAIRTETGHGSGIIYRAEDIGDGVNRYYALTNYHVILDAGEMNVYFGPDEDPINVVDVAGFELYDIAVVRFDTTRDLQVHESPALDDKEGIELVPGQDVFAIGTPEDIDKFNYTTSGILSLKDFTYNGVTNLGLMHNAELNPGNSGGPLFNLNGDLIGINVAKVSTISGKDGEVAAEGLNYSLNINVLATIVSEFKESDFEAVVRSPRLGVTVQEVSVFLEDPKNDPDLLPPDPVGVVVIDLDETREAIDVIEVYDLIIEMNGVPITSIADIGAQIEDGEFGDEHEVTVIRKVDGEFQEFTYTIPLS